MRNIDITDSEDEKTDKQGLWKICLRSLVCIALLWFIISRVDLAEVYQLLIKVGPKAFALAFLIYLIAQLFSILRWKKVLQALQINREFRLLIPLQFIGLFFNQFLPTSIGGDVVKAYYLSKDTKKSSLPFLSVFMDRYLGLCAIIFFAAIAAFITKLTVNSIVIYHWVLLIFVIAVLLSVLLSTDFAKRLSRFLQWGPNIIQNIVLLINQSTKTILKNHSVIIWTFLFSLGIMLSVVGINYIFISSIGKSIELKNLLVFIPLITLTSSLPISINGMGLRECAYIYLFSTIGFTAVESLSLALLNFSLLFLISLPGALIYFLMGKGKTKILSDYKSENRDFKECQ